MEDRKLPQAVESEELILGSIMSRNAYQQISDIISPESFYNKTNKKIFLAIEKIINEGNKPDMISVSQELPSEMAYSVAVVGTKYTFDVRQHAFIVKEKEMLRKLIVMGQNMIASSYANEDVDVILGSINNEISILFQNASTEIITLIDALQLMRENMNKNATEKKELTGLPTGFSKIDEKGGLQKGDLVIVAGESSQGKTSFALTVTNNIAKYGHKVAFYSLEMQAIQLASRITAIESGISSSHILYSKLTYDEFSHIDKSLSAIMNSSIYIDEKSTLSIDTILSSIRSLKAKYNIEMAVVDYLQIIPQNERGKSDEQVLASIARKLKNIAKELNICVIAISQLNRDQVNPEPNIARLRGSGQINEASDVTILVYRPEYYSKCYKDEFQNIDPKGTALINIGKGRNIGTFKFICGFHAPTTKFYELENLPQTSFETTENNPF